MKTSNKQKTHIFKRAAVLITAAVLTLILTACPNSSGGGSKPKPKPKPAVTKYKVTFSVEGANGTLTAKLDGKTITSGAEAEKDKTVVFTATPASGYRVKGWTLDGTAVNGTNSTYSLNITKAVTVKVSFEDDSTPLPQHAVTFGVTGGNGNISAQLDGSGFTSGNTVQEGKTIVFTATPDAQFAVEKWTVDGNPVPGNTANTYNHTVSSQADIKVKFKYTGPALVLNTKDFTKEPRNTFTYTLVTSGSKNYTAVPETPGFFTLDTAKLNSHGNITIRCTAAGASRIRVTDTLSGQSALSGLITVKPVLSNFFAEGGVRYCITDRENLYVSVTARNSSVYTDYSPYTVTSLTIPAKVTHDSVEYTVTGISIPNIWGDTLQSVTVEAANTHLSSQDGVIFNKNKTELLWYPRGKPDTQYTVPAGVKKLEECAIFLVNALQKLVLPEGLTGIENYGLSVCPNLTDISIPSTLRYIRQSVFNRLPIVSIALPEGLKYVDIRSFSECPNLTTVELPSSLIRIGYDSFVDCPVLTTVTCKAVNPPYIGYGGGKYAFDKTPIGSATLKVPAGSLAAYQAANVWKDFGTIEALP